MANNSDNLDLFSRFYAVVLNHRMGSGRRVRWSPQYASWIRSSDYGRHLHDPWLDEPGETYGEPDAPHEEDQAAAVALANSVIHPEKKPFFCQRCWKEDPESHFIAPDVHGDPEIYCLQFPAYSVVDSSGGSGRMKHLGSPSSCQSVEHRLDSDIFGYDPYIYVRAAYVFGRPLPADEVINREWCNKCVRAAGNVRENLANSGKDETTWTTEQAQRHVRRLSRALAEYFGEE